MDDTLQNNLHWVIHHDKAGVFGAENKSEYSPKLQNQTTIKIVFQKMV